MPDRQPVPEPERGEAGSPVFAAVASPARRQLLGLLLEHGPLPVADLAAHFAMRRPSVSEHLRVLKDAGLVSEHRAGRQRYYHLEPQPLQELSQWLSPYERFWRHKLSALRDLLDEAAPALARDLLDEAVSAPGRDLLDEAPAAPGDAAPGTDAAHARHAVPSPDDPASDPASPSPDDGTSHG